MKALGRRLMLRVTLRSFWAHKRRLTLDDRVDRPRRVLHGGDVRARRHVQPVLRRPLLERRREGRRPGRRARSSSPTRSAARTSTRRSPSRSSTTSPPCAGVRVAEPHVITIGFGTTNRVLDPDGDAARRRARVRRRSSRAGIPTASSSAYVVEDGRGPEADDEIALDLAAVEDCRLRGRRHGHRRHQSTATRSTRSSAPSASAPPRAPAAPSPPSSPSPRPSGSPASPGQVEPGARRRRATASARRSWPPPSATALPDDVEVAHRRGGGRPSCPPTCRRASRSSRSSSRSSPASPCSWGSS